MVGWRDWLDGEVEREAVVKGEAQASSFGNQWKLVAFTFSKVDDTMGRTVLRVFLCWCSGNLCEVRA